MEQLPGGNLSNAVITEYQKVVRMEPGSKWADEAQHRIDVIQQNIIAYQGVMQQQQGVMQQQFNTYQQNINAQRAQEQAHRDAVLNAALQDR